MSHHVIGQARSCCPALELQSRSDFVADLSHELRTPLTTLRGWSELLALEWETLGDAERREYAERILVASSRMALALDDAVQVSRIGVDSQVAQPSQPPRAGLALVE